MASEPSEGQIEVAAKAIADRLSDHGVSDAHRDAARDALRAALNYEAPMDAEDEKYDFALKTMDEVMGEGTYAELNQNSQDPYMQRAIARWRARQ